ncbi:MAG: hypothetical protein ACP5EP_12050 [Acidobacteriaceae bacterium]
MKSKKGFLLIAMVLAVSMAGWMFAQQVSGAQQAPQSNTETTSQGTVQKVIEVSNGRGWNGTHLTLKTKDELYDVRVGPSYFITKNGFEFSTGDQIEVIGQEMSFNGTSTIIAQQITKNGKVLTLRDADGFPLWAGQGMGGWHHGRGGCGCGGCGGGGCGGGCGCRGMGGPGCGWCQ